MIDLASWAAGGRSARGAEHERTDRPNQDALAVAQTPCAFVAVADGHGSPRYTRSEIGAAFAVDVARDVLPAYVGDERAVDVVRDELAARIVDRWRARVTEHLASHPLADDEAERIAGPPIYAYGATLVAVAARGDDVLAVQIGDGDVYLADASGVRRLVPRDLRFTFNITTSLCLERAVDEIRVARTVARAPALAVVATDGYAKPLTSERELDDVVAGLYERVARDGLDRVLDALLADVAGASANGGDDVTVGILSRA
jgi:hypothetical protein